MAGFLTPDDLEQLTHKRQPAAQARALRRMGLHFLPRDDGTPAITWEAVNAKLAGTVAPVRPQLNLQAFKKAG